MPAVALFIICIGVFIVALNIILIIMFIIKCKSTSDQTIPHQQTPVVVTSATHSAPGSCAPAQMPVGTTTPCQTQGYLTTYLPQGISMHLKRTTGPTQGAGFQHNTAAVTAASINPPSYDVAVSNVIRNEKNNHKS